MGTFRPKGISMTTEKFQDSRREFIRRAAYVAPAILTLAVAPSYAKSGSEKEAKENGKGNGIEYDAEERVIGSSESGGTESAAQPASAGSAFDSSGSWVDVFKRYSGR
jgi:hypothetical protein